MGLFSIFSKNKQDSTAQDSGRFSRDDDYAQQARAKRASSANEAGQGGSRRSRSGGDPMLPEKKRARRRLVGAIALALAAAVGLPMLLDSEPRPLVGDIAIQIPAKDKAPALPMPSSPVPAAESVDQDEEIIAPPPARPVPAETPAPRAELPAPEPVREVVRAEPAPKPESKPAEKPEASQRFVVQAAALATQEKVDELQARLRAAGVSSYTQKSGSLIRVRVGPFGSREEAEKAKAKLGGMGLSPTVVPG